MSPISESILSDCYRILEETGDLSCCLERYPGQAAQIREHLSFDERFRALGRGSNDAGSPLARQALLTAVAQNRAEKPRLLPRLAAVSSAIAGCVLMLAALSGGAAAVGGVNVTGSITGLLDSLGVTLPDRAASHVEGLPRGRQPDVQSSDGATVTDSVNNQGQSEHGSAVSAAVSDAIVATPPGPALGQAVREAACAAALTRSTLPPAAQSAEPLGPVDPCAASPTTTTDLPAVQTNAQTNHGSNVSQAVADAIAGTPAAQGRGEAVSQAACIAAHDRSDLPAGAQNADPQSHNLAGPCVTDDSPTALSASGSGTGAPPVGAPPTQPGNPVGAPPANPGNGSGGPPVGAPPTQPGNPVGAPPASPGNGSGGPQVGAPPTQPVNPVGAPPTSPPGLGIASGNATGNASFGASKNGQGAQNSNAAGAHH